MTVNDFVEYMKTQFPDYASKFHNGEVTNDTESIGFFLRGCGTPYTSIYSQDNKMSGIDVPYTAIGGPACTTQRHLPVLILVHWTEDAEACEQTANSIYEFLWNAKSTVIGDYQVALFDLKDGNPIQIERDENNICEINIRVNIIYERK